MLRVGFGHFGKSVQPGMLLGGVSGAVLAALLMDWALIFLSSLVGAAAIIGGLSPDPTVSLLGSDTEVLRHGSLSVSAPSMQVG